MHSNYMPLTQPIQLILWDLGDVLVDLDFKQLFSTICPLLQTTPEVFHTSLFSTGIFDRVNRGTTTPQEFHLEVCEALNVDVAFDDFQAAWTCFFQPRPYMSQILHALKGKVEMWLLSNTDPMHHKACQKTYDYLQLLTGQMTSYGLRAMKPEAVLYQRALQHVNGTPESTLFFDDKPENIEGARAQGIHAYLYESEAQCKEVLGHYQLL